MIVDQRAHSAPFAAGHEDVADAQGAALNEHGGDRAPAAFELGLEHHTFGRTVGIGLQIEQLGLQQDRFLEPIEIGFLQRRDFDVEHLAAKLFDYDVVLQQLLPHPLGSRVLFVHLVDGDDNRRMRRLGVADRLDGLLHDAVVGGHHQDHDVGDVGAAGAHRGKRLMAGCVDEGDLLAALQVDAIGADVLGDAAGLASRDIGLAQRVEQRRLAVVYMPHDGDHRRARLQRLFEVFLAAQASLDIRLRDPSQAVSELGDEELGGVGIDDLVDRRHHPHAHQRLDHVDPALGHAVRQFLNGDGLGDDDLAHDLDRLLLATVQPLALALPRASDRGEAAHPLAFVAGKRAGDGDLSGPPAHLVARRRRRPAWAGRRGGGRPLALLPPRPASRPCRPPPGRRPWPRPPCPRARRPRAAIPRPCGAAPRPRSACAICRRRGGAPPPLQPWRVPRLQPGGALPRRRVPLPGDGDRPRPAPRGGARPRRPCGHPAARAPARHAPRRSGPAGSPPDGALARPHAGAPTAAPLARPPASARPDRAPGHRRRSCAFCAPQRSRLWSGRAKNSGGPARFPRPCAARAGRRCGPASGAVSALAQSRRSSRSNTVIQLCRHSAVPARPDRASAVVPRRPPRESRLSSRHRPRAGRSARPARGMRALPRRGQRPHPTRPRSARRQAGRCGQARGFCGDHPPPRRSQRPARRSSRFEPPRPPARSRRPPSLPAGRARSRLRSVAPAGLRADRRDRSGPLPAAAQRAQTIVWLPPAPLYPDAASTTNPVPAGAPRHRPRARRSGR